MPVERKSPAKQSEAAVVIQTGKAELTPLVGNKDLNVLVCEAQHNSGGLFGFSYIDFEIRTSPFDWVV